MFVVLKILPVFVIIILCNLPFFVEGQVNLSYSQPFDWRAGYKESLPEWVFDAREDTLLGVSDPYLKPEVAKEQALQRALFLYALKNGTQVNVLFDYFTTVESYNSHQKRSNKLIIMASFTPNIDSLEVEIIREHYSKYGEAYLAVVVKKSAENGIALTAFGELLLVNNNELYEDQEMKVLLELTTPQLETVKKTRFSCRGNAEYKKVESFINDDKLYIPSERYWYDNFGTPLNDYNNSVRLLNSFWNAQMESLLKVLTMYTFPDVYLKKMDESYDMRTQELKREIVKESISMTIRKMSVSNNSLYVDWQILPVTEVEK